ncbi:MAG: transcription elongation factor GreA, partial [Pirellulaceae bacterium]|nr:transcription elongation factor GreA [Pirellulaceae bacterium]
MPDSVPMTREAFDREKARLDEMKNVERPRIAERVAAAREEGDLKENQEYKGQREQLAHLERKIGVLADKLSRAEIVDPSSIKRDEIAFGATVVVNDLD